MSHIVSQYVDLMLERHFLLLTQLKIVVLLNIFVETEILYIFFRKYLQKMYLKLNFLTL